MKHVQFYMRLEAISCSHTPRRLLPVSKPGSNLVPALASLCKCEGTDDGKQVAPRYTEVLPESCNLGRFSASFLCFFILLVQMHAVPLLFFYSPLSFSSFSAHRPTPPFSLLCFIDIPRMCFFKYYVFPAHPLSAPIEKLYLFPLHPQTPLPLVI